MKRWLALCLAWTVVIGITGSARGQSSPPERPGAAVAAMTRKWTGDLDGMIEHRAVRVLVVYSRTHYFVDKGTQRGITYDFGKAFEENLNKKLKTGTLRVHVVFIPVSRDDLLSALVDGRGDIAAANLTVTPERGRMVDFCEAGLEDVKEIVVTGPQSPAIASLDDLGGREVFVRKSSSYYESLVTLNESLKQRGKPEVILKPAPEALEDEDLLEMLNAGLLKYVVVDNHLAVFWAQVFPELRPHLDLAVRTGGKIAPAVRKNSPKLEAELNAFIKGHARGTTFGNVVLQKYLKSMKFVKNAASEAEMKKFLTLVDLFRKYGDQYRIDWLLMAAQGYQESQLDPNARSAVGAVGVMQVMPATGADMKVGDITQTEPNINAGVKYIRFMIDQYFKNEPMDDLNKALFAFASYNAGPGRIRQLRREASAQGLNPNLWFNNVERIVADRVGRETVQYVSNIYKYYIAYQLTIAAKAERTKAREAVQ